MSGELICSIFFVLNIVIIVVQITTKLPTTHVFTFVQLCACNIVVLSNLELSSFDLSITIYLCQA